MNQNENNITNLPIGRNKQNPSILNKNTTGEVDNMLLNNVVSFSSNASLGEYKRSKLNDALRVFELSCSLEKIIHVELCAASSLAALSAKIVIHAEKLGMINTMKHAQELGEVAMQGDRTKIDKKRRLLQLEVPVELLKVQF